MVFTTVILETENFYLIINRVKEEFLKLIGITYLDLFEFFFIQFTYVPKENNFTLTKISLSRDRAYTCLQYI